MRRIAAVAAVALTGFLLAGLLVIHALRPQLQPPPARVEIPHCQAPTYEPVDTPLPDGSMQMVALAFSFQCGAHTYVLVPEINPSLPKVVRP